jgi:UDP-2,4-diacetamido-2,4,6-trideoxy-beta-L-altropyranose hydrolase
MYIRADATTQIGTGHIMRCIALAQAWQDQGGQVTFLTHCTSEPLRHRILAEGFEIVPIAHPHPDPSDLKQMLDFLKLHAPCSILHAAKPWLVLDGYHFTPDYQKAIRDAGIRLLIIDDMNHLPHYHADILLNQNIHAPGLQYHRDPDTTLLLGTQYVLLRREFLKYRNFKRQIPEKAKNILVTMGGSDPDNVTLKVIEAIKLLNDPTLDVKIIIGPSNPHKQVLLDSMRHAPCAMRCISNAAMPALIAWADLAITAGGSTCWELAFMALPMLNVILANNQRGIAEGLERVSVGCNMGFSASLSEDMLLKTLSEIVSDQEKRTNMSRNGKQVADGAGTIKIIERMKEIR